MSDNAFLDWPHGAQQNAQASQAQNNINAYQQFCATGQMPWEVPRPMTASDLGIIDQLLDDKVGMEP